MNRPRIDDTMRRQHATKNKVRPTLRGSTLGHTYQLLRLVGDRSSYIREEKEGTTPVLGIRLSASSQCTPPTQIS
jgi:hypothetical protein